MQREGIYGVPAVASSYASYLVVWLFVTSGAAAHLESNTGTSQLPEKPDAKI